ncbi:hypothetical protein MHH93_20455 [Priestia sp. FSL H7-0729]
MKRIIPLRAAWREHDLKYRTQHVLTNPAHLIRPNGVRWQM